MDNFIPKGNSHELIVKNNDKDFLEVSKELINKLEKDYKTHVKEINKKEKEWEKKEKKLKETNSYYEPEIIKSAITIIDAPFGTGKSYLIGKLVENLIINKKIKSKIFKNIIVIDVFKYANSKNIPEEFLLKLSNIFISKKIFNNIDIKKIGKFLITKFPILLGNIMFKKLFNIDLDSITQKDFFEKNDDDLIKELKENIEPTIIVLDNIERLSKYSWEIIKTIQKVSEFKEFVFVLPMHLKYLKNNKQLTNNDELPIEKFINIPCFNFKQDYLSFLHKLNLNDDEKVLINEILNEEIDGRKLSIREVEQRFKNNKKEWWEKIKTIINKIWGANKIIEKYIHENMTKVLFQKINSLEKEWTNLKNIISFNNEIIETKHVPIRIHYYGGMTSITRNCSNKCEKIPSYLNINKKYEKFDELKNNLESYLKGNWSINSKEINTIKNIFIEIKLYLNFINKEIIDLQLEIETIEKQKNEKLKALDKKITSKEKQKEKLKTLENVKESENRDEIKISENKNIISEFDKTISLIKIEISNIEIEIKNKTNIIKDYKNNKYKNYYTDEKIEKINNLINSYEELVNDINENTDKKIMDTYNEDVKQWIKINPETEKLFTSKIMDNYIIN